MKWTRPRILITSAFAVALALMIMIGLFSYHSIALLVRSGDLMRRSNVVQKNFQYLLSELKDAETGQWGYLITGDENYLRAISLRCGGRESNPQRASRHDSRRSGTTRKPEHARSHYAQAFGAQADGFSSSAGARGTRRGGEQGRDVCA
jgi:hypothetical protein